MPDAITECVFRAIDRVNELLPQGEQVSKSPSSVLVGPGGALDSMGLINLLLEVESQIESVLQRRISVVDLATSNLATDAALDVQRLVQMIDAALKP